MRPPYKARPEQGAKPPEEKKEGPGGKEIFSRMNNEAHVLTNPLDWMAKFKCQVADDQLAALHDAALVNKIALYIEWKAVLQMQLHEPGTNKA